MQCAWSAHRVRNQYSPLRFTTARLSCTLDANQSECSRAFPRRRILEDQMRKALILAAGLALIGTSAWSQSSLRDDDDDRRGRWHDSRDGWERQRDQDYDRGDRRGRDMRDDDDHRLGGNAHFFVRSGDTQLRVVCSGRESTQACVDAALRMFDRVQSQPRATTNSPTPAPASPPPSQ